MVNTSIKDIIFIICSVLSLVFVLHSINMVRALNELVSILEISRITIGLDLSIIQPLFYITLFLSILSLNLCLNIVMKRFRSSKNKNEKMIYMSIVLISITYCIVIII